MKMYNGYKRFSGLFNDIQMFLNHSENALVWIDDNGKTQTATMPEIMAMSKRIKELEERASDGLSDT